MTMTRNKRLLSTSVALAGMLAAGCSVITSFIPVDETIATDFPVTQEWKEIRPQNPMMSSHQQQMIMLKVEDATLPDTVEDLAANTAKTDWNSLAMPEGK